MKPEAIGLVLIGAFLSFATALFFVVIKNRTDAATAAADEKKHYDDRIVELEKQLSLVTQAVVPLNAAYQAMLVRELTHYHTPEMDELMEKLDPYTLTEREFKRLQVLLRERTRDMNGKISAAERAAAAILPTVIQRAKAELDLDLSTQPLMVVAVPVDKDK